MSFSFRTITSMVGGKEFTSDLVQHCNPDTGHCA